MNESTDRDSLIFGTLSDVAVLDELVWRLKRDHAAIANAVGERDGNIANVWRTNILNYGRPLPTGKRALILAKLEELRSDEEIRRGRLISLGAAKLDELLSRLVESPPDTKRG